MKAKVYNMAGESVGEIELNDSVFGVEYNEPLIHEVIVAQNANARQGTKCTLTRTEVRGHSKKPWKQKHTGHARHGSTKGPQWTGGGVVFAPKPRDFSKKVNKVAKSFAFLSALSQKLAQNDMIILDNLDLSAPKTKEVVNVLNNLKLKGKTTLCTRERNVDVLRAGANIQNLTISNAELLNVYEIVANKNLVITKDAVKSIEEAYAE